MTITMNYPAIDAVVATIRPRVAPTSEYGWTDIRSIAVLYFQYSARAELDPAWPLAQCMHETAWLSSWWAATPRRNPAGIGVTGEQGKGLSFPSWEFAVISHIGRLLAYCLADGEGTWDQQNLRAHAIKDRPLPSHLVGQCRTWEAVAQHWATDPNYFTKWQRIQAQLFEEGKA